MAIQGKTACSPEMPPPRAMPQAWLSCTLKHSTPQQCPRTENCPSELEACVHLHLQVNDAYTVGDALLSVAQLKAAGIGTCFPFTHRPQALHAATPSAFWPSVIPYLGEGRLFGSGERLAGNESKFAAKRDLH